MGVTDKKKSSTTFENIKLKTDFDFLGAIKNLSNEFSTQLSDLQLLENKFKPYKTSTKKSFC